MRGAAMIEVHGMDCRKRSKSRLVADLTPVVRQIGGNARPRTRAKELTVRVVADAPCRPDS